MTRNPITLARHLVAGWLPGGNRHCVMCEGTVWRFMPYRGGRRGSPPLMRVLGMVGSDVDHFQCPRCGAHDRERHLLMYLQASKLMDSLSEMRILHFAPERVLSKRIAALAPRQYCKCDLYPGAADVEKIDIEAMPFDDATFDLVIANHVLEHVNDDQRALREIYRVLATDGTAILQTPFSSMLENTWSDPGILSERARRQAFGQEDHVRLFGRDVFDRFTVCGLTALVTEHSALLPDIDPNEKGINPLEPFFLFRKLTAKTQLDDNPALIPRQI